MNMLGAPPRGRRSGEFERRSSLYARFDVQLRCRTRFFAAAALINTVFARLFGMWPGFHSPRTFEFLRDAGAALEIDNLRYARQISRGRGGALDRTLVCAEQGRLQQLVRTKEMRQPQEWQSIRRELNGLLNHAHAAPFLWWCEASCGLSEVLREIRGPSRLELDFADEWHRILIGLKLIEHVRAQPDLRAPRDVMDRAMSVSAYGAFGRYLTDAALPP
jgi:hypothetical protein